MGGYRWVVILGALVSVGCGAGADSGELGEATPPDENVRQIAEPLTLAGSCPVWGNPNFSKSNLAQAGDVVARPGDNLQTKLDSVPLGKRLVLTSGIFELNTELRLRSYTKIVGQGPTNTIIFATADIPVMSGKNIDTVQLRDFQINGDHNGIGKNCLGFDGTDDIRIDNLNIRNCGHYGIGFQGDNVHQDIYISNTYIVHTGADGIDFKNRACGNRDLQFNRVRIDHFGERPGIVEQAGLDLRGEGSIVSDLWIAHQSASASYGLRFRPDDPDPDGNGCGGGGTVNGVVVLAQAGVTGTRGLGLYGGPTTVNNYCINSNVNAACSGPYCPPTW